jgi:hypothetical protein
MARTRGRRPIAVAGFLTAALLAASCTQAIVDVATLAGDDLQGRNNGTAGSLLAQEYLIDRLDGFAVGADSSRSGTDAFKQPFTGGTNILALIPGGELAHEFVVIGAHYDHIGTTCRTADPGDNVCNGATDNATGVAAVLEIGAAIARPAGAPRRSVILAFWDREEDGLEGSEFYVGQPIVPLADTVAYLNYDIQGANLLPSLRNTTFAVGAETGGAPLSDAVRSAFTAEPAATRLDMKLVSSIFGQNRSDYINFINAGVPTVFFSDSTGPCYHTAQDEVSVVDFGKLERQSDVGVRLARALVAGAGRPPFVASAPLATFDDAVALNDVAQDAVQDLARFTPQQQTQLLDFRDDLAAMVAAGPGEFGSDDVSTLLGGAASAVGILATGVCDGFLG